MRVPTLLPFSRPRRSRRPLSAFAGSFAVLLIAVSGSLAACGGSGAASMSPGVAAGSMPAASMPAGAADASSMPVASMPASSVPAPATGAQPVDTAAVEAAWNARPDYVRNADPRTAEAYRFALERPDVIQWMPCYCGCVAMNHRSNLDCFLRSRMAGGAVAFEEHASFCDICVETALLAKTRTADGRTLAEIRAEVDATWGGAGTPGTNTALPQG